MSVVQQLITILLMALSVMLTRFLAFPSEKHTPRFVRFLGTCLPSAVFGMLIVYCLKDSSLLFPTRWLSTAFDWRTLLAVIVTILLHLWRKSFFLTMAGGTAFYMILTHI